MVGAGDVGLDARRWPPKTAARGPLKLGLAITDAHSGPFWPADGLDYHPDRWRGRLVGVPPALVRAVDGAAAPTGQSRSP